VIAMRVPVRIVSAGSILTSVVTGGALLAACVAAVTAWCVLTEPATIAAAIEARDWTILARLMARGIARVLFAR